MIALLLAVVAHAASYSADMSKLRPVTRAGYAAEPHDAPFVSVFDDGRKRLVFVSGDHGEGVDSAVAKTIRQAIAEHRPKAVIVEGLAAGDRAALATRLRDAARYLMTSSATISENYYAAHAGRLAGAEVLGGEPTLSASRDAARKAGFTDEDFLGFLVARTLPPWLQGRNLTHGELARMANDYIDRERRELGIEKPFLFADFVRWYDSRAGLKKPPEELVYNDVGPHEGVAPTFLQRISLSLDRPREVAIVREIEKALRRHDRVLVVYGSGHLVKQRAVWATLLGSSKDAKPY